MAMLKHSSADEPFSVVADRLNEDGYLIFPSRLSLEKTGAYRTALAPYLKGELPGRNDFEGTKTERVYGLLGKDPLFGELVTDPLVMNLCRAILDENFLLSACLAINIHPGETPQPFHFDDSFYKVPRPRPTYGLSTFWAIDEFTKDNGATEIIPGSHKWGSESPHDGASFDPSSDTMKFGEPAEPGTHPDAETVVMPAGSLMVCLGTLWHRGGANRSTEPRLGITPQYCVAWARQIENMVLAVPPEIAANYPARVQELTGYSMHPPFMGFVDGRHPAKMLSRGDQP